jgi:hypothetical protein
MKTNRLLLSALILLFSIQVFAGDHKKPDLQLPGGSRSLILVNPISDGGITASDLVGSILPPGTPFSNVTYAGPTALGSFDGGAGANLDLNQGVLIGNGCLSDILSGYYLCGALGLPGDADLNSLGAGYITHDATNLEFDFTPTFSTLQFQIIYATTEVTAYYEEACGIFLDGANIAFIPGGTSEISLRTIWYTPYFFVNNDIEAYINAYSSVISVSAPVTPGEPHHLKIAISDGIDNVVNTYLFIEGTPINNVPVAWWSIVLGLGLIVGFTTYRFFTIHRG